MLLRVKGSFALEAVELDVCDDESVKAAVAHVLASAGAIDVLINNAGVGYMGTIEDLEIEDWRRQFETNLFGVLRVTQAALPSMRERKRGRILMMSSVAGLVTVPAQGAYSSSKHALEGLTNALRLEMLPFGIEVILIEPGYIATGMQQAAAELTSAYKEKFRTSPYSTLYTAVRGQRQECPREIENHTGGLRSGNVAGHRSVAAETPLRGHATRYDREMGKTAPIGWRGGHTDLSPARNQARAKLSNA